MHAYGSYSRLISVGEQFAAVKSDLLQEAMHQQTHRYFQRYHVSRMEEVRMYIENEGWELVPVKSSFSVLQLQVH